MLSGSEIIQHRLSGPRELPTSGWKEFCPSNSWLEQKQIQSSLEDKEAIIGLERIEKQTNLARAEWIHERNKAKVLKKVGKYWEVVGHHQDDEDWLFPEEALYLIEVSVLELYQDGVPVSVEHAYALLLGDSRSCTLQEYRVYSYLSRRGYKLIRHSPEITVTRHEKQNCMEDQVLESQNRTIPRVPGEPSQEIIEYCETGKNISGTIPANTDLKISKRISESDSEGTNNLSIITSECPEVITEQTSELNCETEDIYLIEDNIEVIEIDDNVKKISKIKTSNELQNIRECLIVIDDEDDNERETKKNIKQYSPEEESDDDVVIIKTVRVKSRGWYKPIDYSLKPTEVQIVDLCNDNVFEVKVERDNGDNPCFHLLQNKDMKNILDEMINASNGVTTIKAPNSILVPKDIVPKHSEYKVNLNVRQVSNNYTHSQRPTRRQFYNNSVSNNYAPSNSASNNNIVSNNFFNGQRNDIFGNNVLMQACEMRAMAITMMQVASSLMTAVNNNQNTSSVNHTPMGNDNQFPNFYNATQYQNNYSSRHFNNGGTYNYNKPFRNQRNNSFAGRNNGYRRNLRVRSPWNNNSRAYTPNQRKEHNYRFYNKFKKNSSELVDSDEDTVQYKRKKESEVHKTISKKSKQMESVEVIDLCDDVSSVKSEPLECEIFVDDKKFNIADEVKPNEKRLNNEHNFKMNKRRKQELVVLGKEALPQHSAMTLETKNEPDDMQNVDLINTKMESKKDSETKKNEINCKQQIDENDSNIMEESNEKAGVHNDSTAYSPPRNMEIESNGSLETTLQLDSNAEIEGTSYVSNVQEELSVMTEPTSWQQYKEQTENIGDSEDHIISKQIESLIHPDHCGELADVLKNLQIFGSIDKEVNESNKILKISFDVYLPTDHFKKTVKVLPKFRIIVVKSTDPLPSKNDVDLLKTNYQDGIPFIYAIVYDETITFYFYDMISLPKYCD